MWHKIVTGFMILAAVLAGVSVMVLKLRVQEQRERVEGLIAQIAEDQGVIRVLEAEVGYLASPGRLQSGVIAHMPLMPLTADQFITSPKDIPFRLKADVVKGETRLLRAPLAGSAQNKKSQSDGVRGRQSKSKEVVL